MNTSLTIKQENFCLKFVEAGNASEAYRCSYNAGKMKPETINRSATELLANPMITARIKELQAEAKKRLDYTADEKRLLLMEVIERSLQYKAVVNNEGKPIGEYKFDAGSVIRAIAELNKMDGDYAAQKIEQKTDYSFEELLKQLQ